MMYALSAVGVWTLIVRNFLNVRQYFVNTLMKTKINNMKAIWNGKVIAESETTLNLEGNQYFPIKSVKKEFLSDSATHTVCPWKGNASYYNIVVDGKTNKDAAWYYPNPSALADKIKDHVAFWHGVEVTK